MASSVNKVILVGNLGRDPEVRYDGSGAAIANVALATTETWRDKATGEKKEATEWHRLVAFGKLAEIMGMYLKKGSQIYVEGRIRTRKWQDKEGQERHTTEIVIDEMKILGPKPSGESESTRTPAQSYAPQSSQTKEKPGFVDPDDSIPF